MDEALKSLPGFGLWGVVAVVVINGVGIAVKLVLDEVRESRRTQERKEQWKQISNLTEAFNQIHQTVARVSDRSHRVLELLAMCSLAPEVQRRVAQLCEDAREESEVISKSDGE